MYTMQCTRVKLTRAQREFSPDLYDQMIKVRDERDKVRRDLSYYDSAKCQLPEEMKEAHAGPKMETYQSLDAEYVRLCDEICEVHKVKTYVRAKAASIQLDDGMVAREKAARIRESATESMERALKKYKMVETLENVATGKFCELESPLIAIGYF